jgi:hypothetical protein
MVKTILWKFIAILIFAHTHECNLCALFAYLLKYRHSGHWIVIYFNAHDKKFHLKVEITGPVFLKKVF